MHCQARLCSSRITHRVNADDFPDSFYEYRCVLHAAHLMCDPRWDVLELSKTSPIVVRPEAFDNLTNRKSSAMSTGRYILTRCEVIRDRYRKGQISIDVAQEGLHASLAAIGAIAIDSMAPSVWLLQP